MTLTDAAEPRGHTVLQVPVPQLEPFVRERNRHYDDDFLSTDPAFVHSHITALGPFLGPEQLTAPVLDRISDIALATASFAFELHRVEAFPNGIIHLVPEPEGGFRQLTAALVDAFPQCPPYGGQFPDVRPHLTLDALTGSETAGGHSAASGQVVSIASTRASLGELIPAQCRAERLDLAWWSAGDCRILRSWSLGGSHAGRS